MHNRYCKNKTQCDSSFGLQTDQFCQVSLPLWMWSVCSNFIITLVLFPSRLFCLQRDSAACVAVNDTPGSNPACRCLKILVTLLTLWQFLVRMRRKLKKLSKKGSEKQMLFYIKYICIDILASNLPFFFYYFDSTIHFVLPTVKTFEAASQPSLLLARTINISSHMHSNMGLYISNKLRAAGGGVALGHESLSHHAMRHVCIFSAGAQ